MRNATNNSNDKKYFFHTSPFFAASKRPIGFGKKMKLTLADFCGKIRTTKHKNKPPFGFGGVFI